MNTSRTPADDLTEDLTEEVSTDPPSDAERSTLDAERDAERAKLGEHAGRVFSDPVWASLDALTRWADLRVLRAQGLRVLP